MAEVRFIRRVMHSPHDLIDLVSDVEGYPAFINLLSAMRVTNRTQLTEHHERFNADATVAFKFLREEFNSIVNVHRDTCQIDVNKAGKSGAVKRLKNEWTFHELSDGSTLIDFFVEVKLKAFPLEILLRDKFDAAGKKIMSLFEVKARQTCPKIGDPALVLRPEIERLGLDYSLMQQGES